MEVKAKELLARKRVYHPSGGPVMTKQSMRDETDVNLIMDRWLKQGAAVAHLNRGQAMWGDFSSGVDYQGALNAISEAQRDFAALPAEVRSHVDNDPGKFLELVFDPDRREELERLGLVAVQVPREDAGGAREAAPGPGEVKSEEKPAETESGSS